MARNKAQEHFCKALLLAMEREGIDVDDDMLFHWDSAINLGLKASDEAFARLYRGDGYMRKGRISEAKADIEKALELNERIEKKFSIPAYFMAWDDLATIHKEANNLNKAISCWLHLIEQLPVRYGTNRPVGLYIAMSSCEIARILMARGIKYADETATEEALAHLETALKADARFPDTYLLLGVVYDNDEISKFYDPEKALNYYEQYLQRSAIEPWRSEDEMLETTKFVQRRLRSLKE